MLHPGQRSPRTFFDKWSWSIWKLFFISFPHIAQSPPCITSSSFVPISEIPYLRFFFQCLTFSLFLFLHAFLVALFFSLFSERHIFSLAVQFPGNFALYALAYSFEHDLQRHCNPSLVDFDLQNISMGLTTLHLVHNFIKRALPVAQTGRFRSIIREGRKCKTPLSVQVECSIFYDGY